MCIPRVPSEIGAYVRVRRPKGGGDRLYLADIRRGIRTHSYQALSESEGKRRKDLAPRETRCSRVLERLERRKEVLRVPTAVSCTFSFLSSLEV